VASDDDQELVAMVAVIGLLGVVFGAFGGAIATYVTTRSAMRLELEYSYDRALRDKRLKRYQQLFHLLKLIPRKWWPGQEPTRQDLIGFRNEFHDWYFGTEAGGMFLTPAAKILYLRLQDALTAAALVDQNGESAANSVETPLSADESIMLRTLASDLRHQLAEDVGASHPPRLRWIRVDPTLPASADMPPAGGLADRSARRLIPPLTAKAAQRVPRNR
jgi:hypothetical protein